MAKSFETFFMGAAGNSGGDGPIVTSGLVWHVDAGNSSSYPGSGTTWTDISGTNKNVTLYSTSFSSSDGGSIYFDAVNSFGSTSLQVDRNAFSYSAWVKPLSNTDAGQKAIMNTFESASNEWTALSVQTSGVGIPSVRCDNDGTKVDLPSTDGQASSVWQMMTGTRSGSLVSIYINATAKGTNNTLSTSAIEALQPLYVGSRSPNGVSNPSEKFYGYIADLKIYNKQLSSSEITQNFDALKGRYGL